MNQTIKDIPESERPYEKCMRDGESTLSDSELLAVILRCGTRGQNSLSLANEILNHMEQSSYPGLLGLLHSSLSDLKKIHGIGTVKAVQLEMHRRIVKANCMCGSQTGTLFPESGFDRSLLHGTASSSGTGSDDLYDA